jgi:exodeoxyribonuclease VII small subunit
VDSEDERVVIENALENGALQDRISGWESAASSGSFEDALSALESIVAVLDEGKLTLDDSVRCFELGVKLSSRCQQLLEAAELRISTLVGGPEYDDEPEPDPWMPGIE